MSITLKDSRKLSFDVNQSNFDFSNLTPAEAADISAAFCKAVELGCQAVAIATGHVMEVMLPDGTKDYVAKLPCVVAVDVVKNTGIVKDLLSIRKNAKTKLSDGLTGVVARLANGRLQSVGDSFVVSSNNIEITFTVIQKVKDDFDYDKLGEIAGRQVTATYKDESLAQCFKLPSAPGNKPGCEALVLAGRQEVANCATQTITEDIQVAVKYLEKKGEE